MARCASPCVRAFCSEGVLNLSLISSDLQELHFLYCFYRQRSPVPPHAASDQRGGCCGGVGAGGAVVDEPGSCGYIGAPFQPAIPHTPPRRPLLVNVRLQLIL